MPPPFFPVLAFLLFLFRLFLSLVKSISHSVCCHTSDGALCPILFPIGFCLISGRYGERQREIFRFVFRKRGDANNKERSRRRWYGGNVRNDGISRQRAAVASQRRDGDDEKIEQRGTLIRPMPICLYRNHWDLEKRRKRRKERRKEGRKERKGEKSN